MSHLTDFTGLAGHALAIASACLLLPGISRLSRVTLAMVLGVVAVVTLIPLGGLPLAAYTRAGVGDLSITSLLLLAGGVACRLRATSPCRPPVALLGLIVGAAVVLYPMALGVGAFDPYRLGYGDPLFLTGLLALTLAALWRRQPGLALGIALAVVAWAVGWYESANLWDYLVDPLVAIYAASALVARGIRALFRGRRGEA